jgi:hypothetical protein
MRRFIVVPSLFAIKSIVATNPGNTEPVGVTVETLGNLHSDSTDDLKDLMVRAVAETRRVGGVVVETPSFSVVLASRSALAEGKIFSGSSRDANVEITGKHIPKEELLDEVDWDQEAFIAGFMGLAAVRDAQINTFTWHGVAGVAVRKGESGFPKSADRPQYSMTITGPTMNHF